MSACRRAFASIFALFLVALVAGALLAVTSLTMSDARRSTRAAVDAQLRELLHAGSAAALQRLREEGQLPDAPFDLPTPPSLAAEVSVAQEKPSNGATSAAVVRARVGDREKSRGVSFELVNGSWHVRSIKPE